MSSAKRTNISLLAEKLGLAGGAGSSIETTAWKTKAQRSIPIDQSQYQDEMERWAKR